MLIQKISANKQEMIKMTTNDDATITECECLDSGPSHYPIFLF